MNIKNVFIKRNITNFIYQTIKSFLQPNKKFKNNYEFTMNLFELLLENAKSKNINFGENNYDNIKNIITSNKESLNNISNLCLAHTDIWDGNVLIKDGKVAGIVDFSDLYFCDELMTFYFHTIDGITSDYYLKGFDNKKLNFDEKVRIEIYRMYVILKMIVWLWIKTIWKIWLDVWEFGFKNVLFATCKEIKEKTYGTNKKISN